MEEQPPVGTTLLHRSSRVALLGFRCPPGDWRWEEENRADDGHLIVFPGTSVWITQAGHRPLVSDPNVVVLYNRDQPFRRALLSRDGDRCSVVVASPMLLDEVARAGGRWLRDVEHRPFPVDRLPCSSDAFLRQRLLVAHAVRSGDALAIEDELLQLVEQVLGTERPSRPLGRRAATRRAQAELIEHLKAVLATRLDEAVTLDDLASAVATSPFHLARVFRAGTGSSIHDYRDRLRLRVALDRLLDDDEPVTRIGLDLGFANPSHFSDRFRRRFNVPPSAVRQLVGRMI